ncbi:MAG: hypothetical protein O7H40_01280, partial [Gammaproteobacteria bacterium]|nr:hypothetical protein [Gammaproteobacteria bacterium]
DIGGLAVFGEISVPDNLIVVPTQPTTCISGIGLGSTADPLPASFDVTTVEIAILDTATGAQTPLAAFSFIANATTSQALADGLPTGGGPVVAGATWFGFSSPVQPFVLPALGASEMVVFLFAFEFPLALLPLSVNVQFAAGEGATDGTPIFAGDHPVQYFTVNDATVTFSSNIAVPVPGVMPVLACALASVMFVPAGGTRRRRSASP